jgi:hypothetical protein
MLRRPKMRCSAFPEINYHMSSANECRHQFLSNHTQCANLHFGKPRRSLPSLTTHSGIGVYLNRWYDVDSFSILAWQGNF